MAFLTPDKIIKVKDGKINFEIKQKIMPNNYLATKYVASYVQKGQPFKPCQPLHGDGKPQGVTVHNTNDITTPAATNPAEQYCRATYNGNMNGAIVHFYVYKNEVWQLLDETERGWHAADGSSRRKGHRGTLIGGNLDTIAIECIGKYAESEETTAMLVAYLCKKYGLSVDSDVYTHNWWMYGKDVTVPGASKNCPLYILPKWNEYLNKIKSYITEPVEKPSENKKNDEIIWGFLKSKGLNDYAVAGIMGNLYAESALNPKNLQQTYERKFGMTDESYTNVVDNGSYTNFIRDSAGYGLAQWTYWSRKQNLLNYAKSVNKSIGDLTMQLEFLWKELQGYKSVMETLKNAKSVRQASDVILLQYERPANQSVSVQEKRSGYGEGYYTKFAKKPAETPVKPQETPKPVEDKKYLTHTVKHGDSLWTIAEKYLGNGTKYPEIKKLNNMTSNVIYSGTVLKIKEINQVNEPVKETLKVGDKVKLQKDAPCYGKTTKFQSWVYNSTLYVRQINGSRVVISTLKTGDITGAVDIKYLTKI